MQRLTASSFGLTPSLLSDAILDVLECLTRAGFEAYIVGGGVRDLLLGLHPKDFDAVTNATPAQIKQVFGKRCRIIGRRFELAHVYSGREMIEVATFRAPPRKTQATAAGMITRDNAWGTIKQDFARRDISINTLYYQPKQDVILDFCHAIDDIKAKRIRFLGNTLQRVQEDPVRMMRVLRFAAKLQFDLDDDIKAVLVPENTKLLAEVSSHRLFDEVQKMFMGGYLLPLMHKLAKYHIWPLLFGSIAPVMTPFIELAAKNTDKRISSGKTVNPSFFYAVLLWEAFLNRVSMLVADGINPALAWTQAGLNVLAEQDKYTAIPRFAQNFIREVWELQPRLIQPKPRQVPMLAMHPRFRAGFDFLLLREQCGDLATHGMGNWWNDYQHLDNDSREQAISQLNRLQQRQKKQSKITNTNVVTPVVPSTVGEPVVLQTTINSVAMSALATNAYGEIELIAPEDTKPKRSRNRNRSSTVVADSSAHDVFYAIKGDDAALPLSTMGERRRKHQPRKRRPRDLALINMGPRAEQPSEVHW